MTFAFVPFRVFFGRSPLSPQNLSHVSRRAQKRFYAEAKLTARDKRRALEHARINTHREIKKEVDRRPEHFVSAVVSVPAHVRARCYLTPRMAKVKVFLEKDDLRDVDIFRSRVRSGLVRVFPELEQRGLLRIADGFDMKVGGGHVIRDSNDLEEGLQKCQRVGSGVFVEVIPHNTPPPKPPLSQRVQYVTEKARRAMSDSSTRLHMISFFKFITIERPWVVSELLQKAWSRMGVKGRVYVATEGVNAQLSVPEIVLQDFYDAMNGSWTERGETLIPSEMVGVFLNTDSIVRLSEQPFEKLSVRPRDKVLADGFAEPLDWTKSGKEVSPDEWHKLLRDKSDEVVLLDCRNTYESDIGRFEGAEPLNTRTFRETWGHLEERLKHEDRNKKILTYCTGGIRCVKVNAFLEQKMGFKNTGRLEGGIVSYARRLKEDGKLNQSLFKGVNHVFDGRMGEVVTEDLLTRCINCGQQCNSQTDCANVSCPRPFEERMFVQCEDCATTMQGACSESCRETLNGTKSSTEISEMEADRPQVFKSVRLQSQSDLYADTFSGPERSLLRDLRDVTEQEFPNRARMVSTHAQACLLKMLIQISNASRVVELGTFTGYSALAMAESLPDGGTVITCEVDEKVCLLAEAFISKDVVHGKKVDLRRGKAMDTLRALKESIDAPFDVAFIDADKGGYTAYKDFLLDNDLVRVGGLLLFDNVLFRGEVPDIWCKSGDDETARETDMVRRRVNNLRNARRTAMKLHNFNQRIQSDDRVEQVILPFGDGLTLARRVR